MVRCVWCRDDVPVEMIKKIGRDWVCSDCEHDYLSHKGHAFVDDYIGENQKDYYLNWWWEGFLEDEKVQLIKRIYKSYYFHDLKSEERLSDKAEFCLQDDGFPGYVEGRLNEDA